LAERLLTFMRTRIGFVQEMFNPNPCGWGRI
jgi:hypothetical protein